jgi:hypothetical protein
VEPAYLCITHSPRASYDITLSGYLLERYREEIEEDVAQVCIPGGYVSEDSSSVIIPNERRLRLIENSPANQRRLQLEARLGNKKLLAVRVVSAIGEEPKETLAEITDAIFGAAPLGTQVQSNEYAQNTTVVSQYRHVSAGSLNLQAASGSGIEFGVVQVVVDLVVAGVGVQSITNAIVAATEEQLGGSLDEIADYVVFCLPNDSLLQGSAGWTAFTYLYGPVSAIVLTFLYSGTDAAPLFVRAFTHTAAFCQSGTIKHSIAIIKSLGVLGSRLSFTKWDTALASGTVVGVTVNMRTNQGTWDTPTTFLAGPERHL